jgi:hypothetical protein
MSGRSLDLYVTGMHAYLGTWEKNTSYRQALEMIVRNALNKKFSQIYSQK